jgi:hypothetical protein
MSGRRTRLCIVNPLGYQLFDAAGRGAKVFGGAEVQLYYLATALATDPEFDVSMIVEAPDTGVDSTVAGVRMIGVPRTPPWAAGLRNRLPVPAPSYLRAMHRAGADIYLQRGGAVLTGDVALYCTANRRRFVFMAAHDWDCDRHHIRGGQFLAGHYYLAGLHRANLVVTQSRQQREALRAHHGMDSIVQRTVYPALAEGRADRREHVLWVGRCLPWKRPMAFLDLAARRTDQRFVMVCPAYDGARSLYEQVTARASDLPNVRFLDFVPFADTQELFASASIFVNTSTAEGFPNTFVQAARCGTPIASLDVNPDDVLRAADIGDCADGRLDRLAGIINDLLDQPDVWRRRSGNSQKYFEEEHDLTSVLPGFVGALRGL